MLLRRVIEHVRAQNWTAVALDFSIVVIGVFIGIQVSNWNDARLDRARAQHYQERLAGDVRTEIQIIDNRLSFFELVRTNTETVIAGLARPDEALGAAFLLDIYFASSVWSFRRTQDAYDELVSTGDINLIPNHKLRSSISRYYRDLDALIALFNRPNDLRDLVRSRLPIDIQRRFRSKCLLFPEVEAEPINIEFITACDVGLSDEELERALTTLLGVEAVEREELARTATRLAAHLDLKIENLARKRKDAEELLAILEHE